VAGGCGGEKPSPHLAACRAQTAIMPLMAPLPAALRRTHTSSIHTQGNGLARIRPLLPSHYHPLPSPLIGPATAAALTNTRAHAHLYHHLHLHSRFAYPSQGHPPCRHMHQLPPLLGLPSSTTTPPSQSQTYPLAAQQQHWPWELRGTGKANPRTRPRREVRLLLLRQVSAGSPQPPWNDDMRGSFFLILAIIFF